jgi:hypothetical protein
MSSFKSSNTFTNIWLGTVYATSAIQTIYSNTIVNIWNKNVDIKFSVNGAFLESPPSSTLKVDRLENQ